MKQRMGRPPLTAEQVPPGTDPRGTDPALSKYARYYWRNAEKRRAEVKEAREGWTPERRTHHQDVARANRHARRAAHPEPFVQSAEQRAARKVWRDKQWALDPEKVRRSSRAVRLKSKYGVPIDRYEALLAEQGGVCAVCKQPETLVLGTVVAMLGVDNDHLCCPGKKSCGKCVRGLLCTRCNRASGILGDDPVRLRALASYIEAFRA